MVKLWRTNENKVWEVDTSIYDLYTIPKDAGESANSQQNPDGKIYLF